MKLLFFVITLFLFSCTIKMPEIKITGERTTLEKQILGEYMQIEDQQWFLISERSLSSADFSRGKNREMIGAVRERIFLRDDINEFKIKGYLGEDTTSFIVLYPEFDTTSITAKDLSRVNLIVEKENSARGTIIATLSQSYLNRDVKRAFYNLNLDQSPEDSFYRDFEGNWEQK